MGSVYDTYRSGTIYGNPTGRWSLGSDVGGQEAALSGKWIGLQPVYSYPGGSIQVPERAALTTSPLGWVLIGAVLGYLLLKPKKDF